MKNDGILARVGFAGILLAAFTGTAAFGQVPPALQNVRRHMLDANVNALTFHSMDQIFDTRRVENTSPVWPLPESPATLNFDYEFQGQKHPANDVLERTYTNALLVLKHGKIVSEIYRNKTDAKTHFVSFSMAKSITSMLIGMALADGSIHSVDDPLTRYVPELKNSAYDGVTIEQALRMRSGANYDERYDFDHPGLASAAFEESLVQNRVRFADFARVLTRRFPPGEHFNYSTLETAVLGWVLERATHQSIAHYMQEHLWKPAGMESYGFWMLDGSEEVGREFNGAGFNAVARDYARLGLMMLHHGKAQNQQIVPEAWVQKSTSSGAKTGIPELPLGYGYQWWTVEGSQAYTALGLQGQFIYVDPASDTVVVKLSYFPPGDEKATGETLAFLQAASKWEP